MNLREKSDRLKALVEEEKSAGANEREHYERFAQRVDTRKREIVAHLEKRKRDGKVIYGMGAPIKGNTLLNSCRIGTELIDFLVERNELRRGLYAPGSHIPVLLEEEVPRQPDVYLVLAWNFRDEILKRYQHLVDAGVEFYFPVEPDKYGEGK